MPSKSKRNRRVSQDKRNNAPVSNISEVSPVPGTLPVRTATLYSNNPKPDFSIESISENFTRELKWIALVTAIMIVLLIAVYLLFH